MAQPTPYTRLYNLTIYAAGNPAAPYNASQVDAEFNAIQVTIGETLANLALIQKDDGSLANGVVTPDSLDTSTLNLIGDWNPRGLWVTATLYSKLDLVTVSTTSYVCATQHVSGTFATDLAAGKWQPINGTGLTTLSIADNAFSVTSAADATKVFALSCASISAGQTRTWTVPDSSDTFVGIAAVQTLTNKTLTSPTIIGSGSATLASISTPGQLVSTLATGTAPFSIASTTVVPNLNVSQLLGGTWAIPGAIGITTPSSGAFTTLSASGQITSTVGVGTAPFVVTSTTVVGNLNSSLLLGQTWAQPGSIGSTTPAPGAFTTLSATSLADLSGAAAGQIKFPGTQNASSNVNTLDDYQENKTWTPTDGSGAGLGLTVTSATYSKFGNFVIVQADITYPATADGSAAKISGLPFAPWKNCGGIAVGGSNSILAFLAAGSTTITLRVQGGNITNAAIATTTTYITLVYQIAS